MGANQQVMNKLSPEELSLMEAHQLKQENTALRLQLLRAEFDKLAQKEKQLEEESIKLRSHLAASHGFVAESISIQLDGTIRGIPLSPKKSNEQSPEAGVE